jgi:hypothetical protein
VGDHAQLKQVRPENPQAGATMVEVVVAVIILGIAASIMVVSSKTSVVGQLRSKAYGDAATATKEVLESIQILPLDSVSRLAGAAMEHTQGPSVTVRATSRGVLPADVTDFARLDTSSLRHLTLQTFFKNKAGGEVAKTFTTIIFKP